jgi:hypothetical protein
MSQQLSADDALFVSLIVWYLLVNNFEMKLRFKKVALSLSNEYLKIISMTHE